ncbi:unnamed protein product, partial [Mesorhabditis spiculigera]
MKPLEGGNLERIDNNSNSLNSTANSTDVLIELFQTFNTDTHDLENSLLTIIYSLFAFFGLLANLLFCLVIWRNEKLHTVTHVLMTNLALSNLLFLIFHPSYIITTYLLQRSWVFGTFVCKTSFSIAYVTSTASFYFMSLVAIDRWLAIFRRKYRLTRSNSICLVGMAWAVSFVVAAPYMISARVKDFYTFDNIVKEHSLSRALGQPIAPEVIANEITAKAVDMMKNYEDLLVNFPENITFDVVGNSDDGPRDEGLDFNANTTWYRCTSNTASNTVLIWTVILQYVLPLLIMIPTYGHLAHFVWKRAPVGVQSREKRERAHRRRRKLLVTLLSIVLFLIVCWLPLFFVNILMSWKLIRVEIYTRAYIYCSIVTLAGVVITPIFYLINDGCREQVTRLFCCRTVPASERERQALMTTNPYPERSCEVAAWFRETGTTNVLVSVSACQLHTPRESMSVATTFGVSLSH